MDPGAITAVILTRDEQRNLPRAMTSLPRAMPVLVLDAMSRDHTVDFARSAGARVIEREWTDFVDARRYAFAKVETPWTLLIDADEALDDRLCAAVVAAADDVAGYTMLRTTFFSGKPMRMWRDEELLRLVRTDALRVEARPAAGGAAALHERIVCDGTTRRLDGTLLHYSYDDANAYREKFARYTRIEASGLRPSLGAALRQTAVAPVRAAAYLLGRGALLDGPRGWFVAWYSAWYPAAVAWKALQ